MLVSYRLVGLEVFRYFEGFRVVMVRCLEVF